MKLKTKLVSGFLGVASLVAMLGIMNIQTAKNINSSFNHISNVTAPKLVALEEIKVAYIKILLEMNNYEVIKGELQEIKSKASRQKLLSEHLLKINNAKNKLETTLDKFNLLAESKEDKQLLENLATAKQKLYTKLENIVPAKPQKLSPEIIINQKNIEKNKFNQIIEKIDQNIALEIKSLNEGKQTGENKATKAIIINIISVTVVVLMANIIGVILAEKIAKPIIKLKKAAIKVGQGNLNTIVDIEDKDEIGILAKAFNQMVEDLKRTTVSKYYVDNIIRSMMDALIVLAPDATIQTFNFATLLLLEYDDEKDLLDKPVEILLAENDFLNEFGSGKASIINSFIGRKETTLLTKNGREIPVTFSASIMRDREGEIQGIVCLAQDISTRKQAEAVLRRQALTFENISDGVILTDLEGHIIDCNPAAEKMFGYMKNEVLERTIEIFYRPQEAAVLSLLTMDGLRRHGRWSGEIKFIRKDGSSGVCETVILPLRDEHGEMIAAIGVNRDITERKRAEQALRESEAKWRSLVENAPDMILTVDIKGKIQFINRVASGLNLEEVIGSSVYDLVPAENRENLQKILEKVFSNGLAQTYEMPGIGAHGRIAWYSTRVSPIFNNNRQVVALTLISRDISDRKQMEEALRESEARLEGILNSLTDIVWSADAITREMLYLNPATEKVYGCLVIEFFDNPNLWMEMVHPEDLEQVKYAWQVMFITGSKELEYRIIRPDKEIRWLHERSLLICDSEGNPIRIDGIATDITERKLAQETLEKANEKLEIRVQERTKELSLALARLQQEIEEKQIVAEALRQSEEKLNGILNSLDDVVWSADANTWEILYISPAAEKIYGTQATQETKNLNIWLEMIYPEDRDQVRQMVENRGKKVSAEIEYRIVAPNGKIRWVRSRSRIVYNSAGEAIRIDGIDTDITKRKQAEEILLHSEAQLRKKAQQEELINQLASQIRNSLDLDTILETAVSAIRNLLEIDRCLFTRYNHKQNHKLAINTYHSNTIINQEYCHLNSVVWEVVKEAKQPKIPSLLGQDQIEFAEMLMQQILNNELIRVDDVATLSYTQQKNLYQNWGYTAILALPIKRQTENTCIFICGHCTSARFWNDNEVALLEAITDQLAIAISQAELYAQATNAAKIAQEQAQQIELTLKALQQTQAQLIQTEKMSSLGQMVAGIAHEINNPISFIYGNIMPVSEYIQDLQRLLKLYQEHYPQPIEIIAQEIESIELDFLLEDLDKILNSMKVGADRIREIVLSLRNFSRLDEAEMKKVDIHEGIDNTLLILQHRLKAKADRPEIKIIKEYGNLPKIECYAGQLNQVFMNLLANATDALDIGSSHQSLTIPKPTPNNGYMLEVNQNISTLSYQPNPTIHIRTKMLENDKVIISIADNGPGMTEEVCHRIFDPFFTTKPVGQGTGLGLSISYQIIIEKHRGQIKCISKPGAGAEFIIELPVKQRHTTPVFINA